MKYIINLTSKIDPQEIINELEQLIKTEQRNQVVTDYYICQKLHNLCNFKSNVLFVFRSDRQSNPKIITLFAMLQVLNKSIKVFDKNTLVHEVKNCQSNDELIESINELLLKLVTIRLRDEITYDHLRESYNRSFADFLFQPIPNKRQLKTITFLKLLHISKLTLCIE